MSVIRVKFVNTSDEYDGYTAYYASASASGGGTGAIGDPWTATEAFANATAGDVVYFRGGTYDVVDTSEGLNGGYEPTNSGTSTTNRVVFAAYTGETPLFNVTTTAAGKAYANGSAITPRAISLNQNSYITLDGFSIQGNGGANVAGLLIWGDGSPTLSVGNTIKNCTLNGGTTTIASTNNIEAIRVDDSNSILIKNNTISSYRQSTEWHNCSAIKTYVTEGLIIENNDISDCSEGPYIKADNQSVTIRYNFIHDCYELMFVEDLLATNDTMDVYHNVFANAERNWQISWYSDTLDHDNLSFYNNTVAQATEDNGWAVHFGPHGTGLGPKIYNNIFHGSTRQIGTELTVTPVECDSNCFYSSSGLSINFGTAYTSLASWQTSGALYNSVDPGVDSVASDPTFTNGSTNLNLLSDFTLDTGSPCLAAGRSGVDMGADISLVGVQ